MLVSGILKGLSSFHSILARRGSDAALQRTASLPNYSYYEIHLRPTDFSVGQQRAIESLSEYRMYLKLIFMVLRYSHICKLFILGESIGL